MLACTYCNKKYQTPATLKRHLRSHTGNQPHQCIGCKKRFSVQYQLKQHVTKKINVCIFCNKKLFYECAFRKHLQNHGEGLYECKYCLKQFLKVYIFIIVIVHIFVLILVNFDVFT